MSEKKKYVINCDICDTRKIIEDQYKGYEEILIQADVLVQNARSKDVLSRLPVQMHVDQVLEVEDNTPIQVERFNGNYEITPGTATGGNVVLLVNGNLSIAPGSEEVLKHYRFIEVNGSVRYPQSLAGYMPTMTVNGARKSYPDGAVILKDKFQPDKYFAMRAKDGGVYYADKVVYVTDLEVDVKTLKEKQIRFLTKKCVVAEELLQDAVALFDEQVEMVVVPVGYTTIIENEELTKASFDKYGNKQFYVGNLRLMDEGIEKLKALVAKEEEVAIRVEGSALAIRRMEELLPELPIDYKKLEVVKGELISGKGMASVSRKTLELYPDGVTYKGVGLLKLDKDITPEEIGKNFSFRGVGMIQCTAEQADAVQGVSSGVGNVSSTAGAGGTEGPQSLVGMLKQGLDKIKDTKLVNADDFVM